MDLDDVLRFGSSDPEPIEFVTAIEVHCGVTLPEFLKDLYAIGDQAHAGPIKTISDPKLHFDFHAVRKTAFEYYGTSVIEAYDFLVKLHPSFKLVVPIGGIGNGDEVCLDYRGKSIPSVVLYNHEIAHDNPEPFEPLAESFERLFGIGE